MNIKNAYILLDKGGKVSVEELSIGRGYPEAAEFFCDIPHKSSPDWITGTPDEGSDQFLVLSGRIEHVLSFDDLDISVQSRESILNLVSESTSIPGWSIKHMPTHALDFRPVPSHIPRAIYTFGLHWSGKDTPIQTIKIKEDNKERAVTKAYKELKPSISQRVKHLDTSSNPEYDNQYNKKPKFKIR